jgi:hypothetical protein
MKNLMIYISPTGSFDNPRADLASNDALPLSKIQIENSQELGWDKKDIILATNFAYHYGDIQTTQLYGVDFFNRKPQASKINAIIKLFDTGAIQKNELYWFHDLDAFQLEAIVESEIDIKEDEIAMTDFGGAKHFRGMDRWSGGVIYFKSESKDIFDHLQDLIYKKGIDEEEALGILLEQDETMRKRVKKINNTYNFIGYNLRSVYEKSLKPLKVVHFHPLVGKKRLGGVGRESALRFFKGENELNIPLITERLNKIFAYHGIR